MISYQLIFIYYLLFILKLNNTYQTCFKQSNDINYLFLNDLSQIKIPLIPLDCIYCQSAYQIDIQLIDEQMYINRTIQRIKIYLKNFEIEDSSYICLINPCPIFVEYGSDIMILNITSSLFSHVFLSLIYLNHSILCSIQTRFAIFSLNKSLTCTKEISLHPRLNSPITRQFQIFDCQAELFYQNIYQTSMKFSQNNQKLILKSTENPCEYIIENSNYLNQISSIQSTRMTIYPIYNPWKKDIQILGPCQTKIISYKEMFFTNDIGNIRKIFIEKGQTIQIQCPIDGSEKYLKYTWYYQRYQPKYQISNNRTIILTNITEQMQGKYMCIGDDENEKLEFEMTLHLLNSTNSFYVIIIFILLIILILFCLVLTFLLYFSLKNSSPSNIKPNSLTIHHDVMLTIQHLSDQQSTNSLWNQSLYQTLDYIDDQSTSNQLSSKIHQEQIPYRFSTRHRNFNGQLSVNIPFIQSTNEKMKFNDIEILKISVPLLNEYPTIKSSNSIISFDSQNELDQFNQMTSMNAN